MHELPESAVHERGPGRGRILAFALICAVCLSVAVLYVYFAREAKHGTVPLTAHPLEAGTRNAQALAAIRTRPHVMYLATSGDEFRRLAFAALDDLEHPFVTDVECLRFYFAHGHGLALDRPRGKGRAFVFDRELRIVRSFECSALPSRVRLSADGRFGAWTVFVAGDSYATAGFSTRTSVVDLENETSQPFELERLHLWRGGRTVDALDINYWGVTFPRDRGGFYATVQTNDHRYLVQASLDSREANVLSEEVECPSLSPDGKRIAFKRRFATGLVIDWNLYVLDLETMARRRLEGETRSIDDQVEWLDDGHLLYALRDEGPPPTIRPDVWELAVDDGSPPKRWLKGAMSPCVVRP
jgi:dipeptidyl aminopeptidase/acylaminoacyl peptidase